MVDVIAFAALGWERRAVTDALVGVEPAAQPHTWQGRLGDGSSCLVIQTGIGIDRARAAALVLHVATAGIEKYPLFSLSYCELRRFTPRSYVAGELSSPALELSAEILRALDREAWSS